MIKRSAWQEYKRSEGKINIVKESGKESSSQLYYGSPPILLTMITSMVHTLVVKNKVFTKDELIMAVNLGSQENESE